MESITKTILIVDDESLMRESLYELLMAHGYDALMAASGNQALETLREREVSVMLLDLMMPDMTGHEVMREVSRRWPDVRVIVVSGESSLDGAVSVLRDGAYDYLRKPYAPEVLLKSIENAVTTHSLQRANADMQARLQASEKLHRYIVNHSPDMIYMLDLEGRFTFVNESAQTLLGYTPDELLGRAFEDLLVIEDMDHARHDLNQRRERFAAPRHLEMRLKRKDGVGICYVDATELPVHMSPIGEHGVGGSHHSRAVVGTYGVARDVSERKRAEEIITYQANHDLLTGLPNRNLLRDRLSLAISQARRLRQTLAVMFMDLDRFKLINDTLGHTLGDDLLRQVSARIRQCIRDGDTLARVGGDEFTILLPDAGTEEEISKVAQKISGVLKKPFKLDGQEVYVSASIGVSLYPRDGKTIDNLIKHSDIAMYHIKERGKDGVQFFSHHMNAAYSRYLALERGMREALSNDQFEVFYQPQIDTRRGEICGVEALIRWRHPSRGMLLPLEFVPLAEENGLIVAIGQWLLDRACAQILEWRAAGAPDIRLAVNLSALQLEQPTVVHDILSTLERHRFPGEWLELELTENVIMKDMDIAVQRLQQLNSYGIRVAIDDFGTGYSSLSYLRKLPIDTLKIDRSFVHDMSHNRDGGSIVAAIVAMAKGLKLSLVAEGVEAESQSLCLQKMGCHLMQGYWYSKPVSADALGALLRPGAFADAHALGADYSTGRSA